MRFSPSTDEQGLIRDLAASALERAAPEELVLLPETADEYFHDPQSVLNPKHRDEAVGFGLDVALLAPYVLAAATPVVHLLLEAARDTVREEVSASLATAVRRRFRRGEQAAPEPDALSPEQLKAIREAAFSRACASGADAERAALIADAIVGGLVTA